MNQDLHVFYEDNYIIVCEKPAKVPSQSDHSSDYDMVSRLKNYRKENEKIKGEPFIGLVHRLDRPVGGVMVFAKTPNALKKLNDQIRQKKIIKCYRAISDIKTNAIGTRKFLSDYIVQNTKTNTSEIVPSNIKNSKIAELYYSVLYSEVDEAERESYRTLLDIELITGRHHQIRVQMANEGLPLWGDTKYNKGFLERHQDKKWVDIALYSYKIQFEHPVTGKKLLFENIPEMYRI